jgi:hypothetical protein
MFVLPGAVVESDRRAVRVVPMAPYDALELEIIDQEQREYIRVDRGVSVQDELVHFLKRTHDYQLAWVKVEGDKYVRYDRIASVAVRRSVDDGG